VRKLYIIATFITSGVMIWGGVFNEDWNTAQRGLILFGIGALHMEDMNNAS